MTGRLVVAALLAAGCSGVPASSTAEIPPDSGQQDTVDLDEREVPAPSVVHEAVVEVDAFYPLVVDARVGDRVRWTWRTGTPRTIVSGFACVPDGIFASPTETALGQFEIRMPVAGPFPYYAAEDCSVVGLVSVSP